MTNWIQTIAFAFLLGASSYFGYIGKPTEMGLSILASVLALAFTNIDKIRKFKGAGFEAEMRDKVEAMVAKEAEPSSDAQPAAFTVKAYGLDENTRKVVKSLGNSKYTWRSLTGLARESGLPASTIKVALHWLSENGLAVAAGVGRQVNWGLTEEGRELFNAVSAAQEYPSQVVPAE
ncbi:MAG: hypothetical protein Q8R06_00390 [Polaromonas sp.]|uniref:hypothetical protein n=1 Tax=Polaromonas sp. TaxID=1869339 RepID=UPI00273523CB|nr:hypothetical protein [Polaromonas sp.]MDP3795594.1 hypothetical protein [Polaromonas sp.]